MYRVLEIKDQQLTIVIKAIDDGLEAVGLDDMTLLMRLSTYDVLPHGQVLRIDTRFQRSYLSWSNIISNWGL